ncbi:LOW QUALITY PROTEIN: 40S ribosomal protein S3a-like [Dromiciops gliroides]|uniref:LOW QUALITY PROTEIN: 40S ribosomal protein S3a-like n=1 Tax=Dromiciops gliroides TaxID=33562 RepID=UPI001CC69BB4|nr:LOW QUALITY PROTEIN: 40S ribosomal protein S3a-like [Dromiciops gliroides]
MWVSTDSTFNESSLAFFILTNTKIISSGEINQHLQGLSTHWQLRRKTEFPADQPGYGTPYSKAISLSLALVNKSVFKLQPLLDPESDTSKRALDDEDIIKVASKTPSQLLLQKEQFDPKKHHSKFEGWQKLTDWGESTAQSSTGHALESQQQAFRSGIVVVGKNKHLTKGSQKGAKKKVVDPFSKKDWYDVKAPAMLNIRNIGKTLVTRTQGTKIASDGLKGRVFEVSLADLQNDEVAFRKFKLITEDVQGKNCLTNFHRMDLTRDKMCSMVKKWQTMIEAHVNVKTTDGYLLRLFCVGFTKKHNNQIRKTSYAQHQQVRQIRKKIMEIMTQEVQKNDLKEVVNKLIPDSIGKYIEEACQSIYPLHDVFVRKVKMLKKPKFELGKLMELHGEGGSSGKPSGDETGTKVERADGYEPPVQESV